jgi:hypothetical protein
MIKRKSAGFSLSRKKCSVSVICASVTDEEQIGQSNCIDKGQHLKINSCLQCKEKTF